jgi:hypothetical protein
MFQWRLKLLALTAFQKLTWYFKFRNDDKNKFCLVFIHRQDYTITIYLNQYWRDERLVFGKPTDYFILMSDFTEKIWVPDTFFAVSRFNF